MVDFHSPGHDYNNTYVPLELNTPTGLGAFLSNSTLKLIGISLHSGGLYSYYNVGYM